MKESKKIMKKNITNELNKLTKLNKFDQQKRSMLNKLYLPDKSKKGNVDKRIIPLINKINSSNNFYTTSSCSGRISLFVESESGKKNDSEWLFVTHEKTNFEEMKKYFSNLPKKNIWFRMEGAIIHVVARDEESANYFLQSCRESGFKKSGMLSTTKRIVIEAIDSNHIDVPIITNGKLIVEEKFIKFLIKKSNKKLEDSWKNINKLKKKIKY